MKSKSLKFILSIVAVLCAVVLIGGILAAIGGSYRIGGNTAKKSSDISSGTSFHQADPSSIEGSPATAYTVTYHFGDEGDGNLPDTQIYSSGSTVSVDFENTPHHKYDSDHYNFAGWTLTEGYSEAEYTSDGVTSFIISGEVNLYPVWVSIPGGSYTYTVTYASSGVFGSASNLPSDGSSYSAGDTVYIDFMTTPTKDGGGHYRFIGYTTNSMAMPPVDYESSGTTSFVITNDVVLYPVFEEFYVVEIYNNTDVELGLCVGVYEDPDDFNDVVFTLEPTESNYFVYDPNLTYGITTENHSESPYSIYFTGLLSMMTHNGTSLTLDTNYVELPSGGSHLWQFESGNYTFIFTDGTVGA